MSIKDWGDAKRIIVEDLGVYGAIGLGNLGFDCFCNLLHALNLRDTLQPYSIGISQMLLFLAVGIMFARRITELKYYK